jgi:putative hydrolase of the HAD superfamily
MSIEMVFFDAGETLLRPHPSFPELFATVCKRNGRDVDPADVAEVQDRLAPYLVDLAHDTGVEHPSLSPEGSRTFWTHLYTRFLGELGIVDDDLAAKLFATFSSSSSYKLFDDVLPTLRQLQAEGYRLGLISNFEEWLEEMLVELEVGDFFDTRVISGSAGVEKPDPQIYRIALDRAGIEPGVSVHVGDSPYLDIEPASSVGMKTVLLDRKGRHVEARVPRIRSLKDLPATVANLQA